MTSDMTPTTWGRRKLLELKEEPGDARGDRRDQKTGGSSRNLCRAPQADRDHHAASNGDELITTCNKVKARCDIPRIMP